MTNGLEQVANWAGMANASGTFVDAMLGMNAGEIWTRRKFITNTTELQFWLGFDPQMARALQLGREGQGRRVILAAKLGDLAWNGTRIYVPTWDDYDAEDWMRRSVLS